MKKSSLALLIALSFSLVGCSSSPGEVTKDMMASICNEGGAENLREYVTDDSQKTINMMVEFQNDPKKGPKMKEKQQKGCADGEFTLTITEEKIDGDTAIVSFVDQKGEKGQQKLVKVDGDWKALVKK